MQRGIRLLSRLFNIRSNEWPRFLLIYAVYFITLTGWQWGRPVVEAAFLTEVGVEFLPWVFVVNGIVTIIGSAIYTAFADRVNNTKLLVALFIVSILGVSVGLFFLISGSTGVIVPLIILFLVLNVPLLDIFNIHWPIYVNSFYNTQSAKRIIPLLASGARFAGIAAGLSLPYLNQFFQPDPTNSIVIIWLSTLIIATIIAALIPRLLRRQAEETGVFPIQTVNEPESESSYLDNVREGFQFVYQSQFLRWLALGTILTFTLLPLINYQSLQLLDVNLQSEEEIANFIALLNVIGNLIALPIQLFVLNRLISRVGLGNASLIFPIATLGISATLSFFRTVPAAALGYINGSILRTTFRNPVDNLLYNAVPLRVKGRARAFIVGFVVPIGGLIGGLLLFIPAVPNSVLLFVLIGILAVGLVVTAFMVRRQYSHALITMLEQEDFSFIFSQQGSGLIADPATLGSLKRKLDESSSPEFAIFMAQLISQVGGNASVQILAEAIPEQTDGRVRAAMLDVLAASGITSRSLRDLYVDFLGDVDGQARLAAVAGLEQLVGPEDEQFHALVVDMLHDPDVDVELRVLSALARSGDFYNIGPAVDVLNEFLGDKNVGRRAQALRILGEVGDVQAVTHLADYITEDDDAVRLAAVSALEPLVQLRLPEPLQQTIVERTKTLLHDPVERVRQAALNILAQLGDQETHRAIVGALTDPSAQVRATAVDALVKIGRAVIPIVHPQFDATDPQLRKMATVVLSQVNPKEYGPLVNTHITSNLLTIYRNHGLVEALRTCQVFPSIGVMQNALAEQNNQLIDEIFYLLMAIHNAEDVRIVADSLESHSVRMRANATEALESLTSPQTAQLIAPLFEKHSARQLINLSRDVWNMETPTTIDAVKHLVSDPESPWFRAIMTFALGEMGAALTPKPEPATNGTQEEQQAVDQENAETDDSATGKPSRLRRRRQRAGNLLNLLDDAGDSNDEKQEEPEAEPTKKAEPAKKERRKPRRSLVGLLGALDDEPPKEKLVDDSPAPEPKQTKGLFDSLKGGVLKKIEDESTELDLSKYVPLAMSDIEHSLERSFADENADVRLAARAARRTIAGFHITDVKQEEVFLLSTIEKIIFLKEVPFFQGMTIYQLEVLANISEEKLFHEDERIFEEKDAGGALYVVVNGRVGIEQERRKGSYARLATLGPRAYFGETSLFDNSPRSSSAIAIQDTLTLRVRREPLIALARQYPDLSLELISVLSHRLRDANDRIADLTRTRPRELQKLFDKFD